jgi:hypothetical protein
MTSPNTSPNFDRPLFDLIDKQGNPETPTEQKLERIFDVGDLLLSQGVESTLVADVVNTAEQLGPLGALTLARRPTAQERTFFEGRGSYHTGLPVADRLATLYNKGTGSEQTFDKPAGLFTGFPSQADKLFFDGLTVAQHPRMTGTETVRWALMEAVNAGYIFAYLAKREHWTGVEQAIDAGVTVPLNVMHFKELSCYLGDLLTERKNAEIHPLDEKALNWDGNKALGSVSMIVPDHVRIAGGIDSDINTVVKRLINPEVAQTAARTLRTLLEAGFCYSSSSSHGQNLYKSGLMGQADNSDLISLGDYRGRRIEWSKDAYGLPTYKTATAEGQRATLLFYQLESDGLLTPKCAPIVSDGIRTTWEQTLDTQQAFWQELLGQSVAPEALNQMLRYMPLMRTEFNIAAALLLLDAHDDSDWESLADAKRATLAEYETAFGVLTEYDAKVQSNLHEIDTLQYDLHDMVESGKLLSLPIINYLRTGNEDFLLNEPILQKATKLIHTLEAMADPDLRDEVLCLCAAQFASRNTMRLDREPDLVTLFEGRHYDLLNDLLSDGRTEDAKTVLQTLSLTTNGAIRGNVSIERDCEVNTHKFPRLLLEKNAPYQEILQKAQFEYLIDDLGQNAYSGGQSFLGIIRGIFDSEDENRPLSVTETAEAAGFPPPRAILKAVAYSMIDSEADRHAIIEGLQTYAEKLQAAEQIEDESSAEYLGALDELDAQATAIGAIYPELELAHNSTFAGRCAKTDPIRAKAYFERAMAYYQTLYAERAKLSTLPPREWEDYSWMNDPVRKKAVADLYAKLNLPRLAFKYSKSSYFSPEW